MVFHKKPIAHVHAVAIDGQLFAFEGIENHERDQFFRELSTAHSCLSNSSHQNRQAT